MTKIFIIVRNRSAIQYSYVATTRIRIVWTEMVRKKRTRLHVGCLNCFRPSIAKRQNDGNTIAYVFVRPLDPSKLAFSKKLHSRDRFWKPAFFVPENAVYLRKAKTENKSPFSKYPDKCKRFGYSIQQGRRAFSLWETFFSFMQSVFKVSKFLCPTSFFEVSLKRV